MLTVCDSTDRSECHHMGVMESTRVFLGMKKRQHLVMLWKCVLKHANCICMALCAVSIIVAINKIDKADADVVSRS